MKRMIDQASFEQVSTDVKEIQVLLSGKAFFDGSILVEDIEENVGIKAANLPSTAGIYKGSRGVVLCVTTPSELVVNCIALYDGALYYLSKAADEEVDFVFDENTRQGTKPLYFHPLSLFHAEGHPVEFMCSLIVINDSPEPIDTWAKLTTYFDSVYDNLPSGVPYARFPCTGFIKDSSGQTTLISSVIEIIGKDDNSRRFVGMNFSDGSLARLSAQQIAGAPRIDDGINRIN